MLLSLPGLERIAVREIAPGVSALLAPVGGPYLIAVDTRRNELQVFDRDTLIQIRQVPLRGRQGETLTFSRMTESPSHRSVIIDFGEAELWELFLAAEAEPVFEGLVHDYRMGEGMREARLLPIRRIALDTPVNSVLVETDGPHLILLRRIAGEMTQLSRLNLDVRRVVATASMNKAADELSGAIPAPGQAGMLLIPDLDGVQRFSIAALQAPQRIALAGENCRIAATRDGKLAYLRACGGGDQARIFILDPTVLSVKALLQPSTDAPASLLIADRNASHHVAVIPGDAGLVVRYRTSDWCRVDQLAVPRLETAWIYP